MSGTTLEALLGSYVCPIARALTTNTKICNMKKGNYAFLMILLFITAAAFAQQTETRNVPAFDKLDIGGSFDAVLKEGNETSVKITAENIDVKKIITETKENTLRIFLVKGIYHKIRIKLEITYKNLDAINRSGSGNLTCESDITTTGDFHLSSNGSGNITINGKIRATGQAYVGKSGSGNIKLADLQAEGVHMNFSGSGNFDVDEGNAKKQTIRLSGSGNVSAYGLKTETCTASVSGSGDIKVYASSLLEATILGSGNINYRGDAQVKKVSVHGSGRIDRKG
jgi:hypothetical protein